MCRPSFVEASKGPLLSISNGRHPCILHTHGGGDFIPNDVVIEGGNSCLLVTGPNMGGKSTLMRQTGLLVVLAHLVRVWHSLVLVLSSVYLGLFCPCKRVQVDSSGQGFHSNGCL